MRGWLLVLSLGIGTAPVQAATFYFAASGTASGTCQQESAPCQGADMMNRVFARLEAGDQVLFQRGERLHLSTVLRLQGRQGTQDRPIILGAYGAGERPVLARPYPGSDGYQIVRVDQSSWVVIQDLEFFGGKGAVDFRGSTQSTFQRNRITTCYAPGGGGCVHVGEYDDHPSSFIAIVRNEFFNTVAAERIYIGVDPSKPSAPDLSHDILIEDNTFTGNGSATRHECIEMKAGSQRVTIRRNRFLSPGALTQNGCVFSSLGATGYPAGQHVIEHNWFEGVAGPKGYAIRIRNSATIRGNTIIGCSQQGLLLEQPAGDPHYARTVEENTVVRQREDVPPGHQPGDTGPQPPSAGPLMAAPRNLRILNP